MGAEQLRGTIMGARKQESATSLIDQSPGMMEKDIVGRVLLYMASVGILV